jgi:hypothetical protein
MLLIKEWNSNFMENIQNPQFVQMAQHSRTQTRPHARHG